MSNLTRKDVEKLAALSGLSLNESEKESLLEKLSETITFVHNLNELDTSNVSQHVHMSFAKNVFFKDGAENKRLLTKKEALQNAKKTDEGMFEVEKIM